MAGNQESKDRYLKEKVETFLVRVPIGRKIEIQNFAKNSGYRSLNHFVVDLINNRINDSNIQGNQISVGNITGDNNANIVNGSNNINTNDKNFEDSISEKFMEIFNNLPFEEQLTVMNIAVEKLKNYKE